MATKRCEVVEESLGTFLAPFGSPVRTHVSRRCSMGGYLLWDLCDRIGWSGMTILPSLASNPCPGKESSRVSGFKGIEIRFDPASSSKHSAATVVRVSYLCCRLREIACSTALSNSLFSRAFCSALILKAFGEPSLDL